ncbi:hypothetical protein SM114_11425 [Erwinia pyrifoliae]
MNLYAYAPNPYGWVDPLGLAKCNSQFNSRKEEPLELRKEMQEYPHRINLVIFSISETKEYNNIIA